MSITAKLLYRDTRNFFRHELTTIVLMAVLISFVTMILHRPIKMHEDQLALLLKQVHGNVSILFKIIHNMPLEQQRILFRTYTMSTLATLFCNTMMLGGMLCLIQMISNGHRVHVLHAIANSASLLPKLLLQNFIINIIVQLGFIFLIAPGIILANLLSLAPVLLVNEKISIIKSMNISMRLARKNIQVIMPAVTMWLLIKIILIYFFSLIKLTNIATLVILNTCNNIIYAILIIYLYRLYTLLRKC